MMRVQENLVRLFLLAALLVLLLLGALHVARYTTAAYHPPAVAITCTGGSQNGCGGG